MPHRRLKQLIILLFTDGTIRGCPLGCEKTISVPEAVQRDWYAFVEFTANRAMSLYLHENSCHLSFSSVKLACAKHYCRGGTPIHRLHDKRPNFIKFLGWWFRDQPTGWKFPVDIQARLIQRNLKVLTANKKFVVSWVDPAKVLNEFLKISKGLLAGKTYSEPDIVMEEQIRAVAHLLQIFGTSYYDPLIFKEQKDKVLAHINPQSPQQLHDYSDSSSDDAPEPEVIPDPWADSESERSGDSAPSIKIRRRQRPQTPQGLSVVNRSNEEPAAIAAEFLPEIDSFEEHEVVEMDLMHSLDLVGRTEAFGGGADMAVHVERRRADNSQRQSLQPMPW